MRRKSDKPTVKKAAKDKTSKAEPAPPVEQDKGHGEEVEPAKQGPKR
jgi:hypothetical protein